MFVDNIRYHRHSNIETEQPTAITDPEGNTTTYEYDRIGRVTSIDRPDQGLTKTSYDPAGHITDIETSQGEHISYKYNYDQLISKTYSERYWNDSHYEYGSPTDGNASGRVIKIQDASGIKEQRYDRMGNIDHERHTLVQPYSSYTINLETLWNSISCRRSRKQVGMNLKDTSRKQDFKRNIQDLFQAVSICRRKLRNI